MHPLCGNCRTYFSNRVQACDYGPSPPKSRNAPVGPPLPKSSQSVPVTRTNRSLSPQRRIFHIHALLPQTVGLTTLDPFNTQLKSRLPSADQLLHHCTQYLSFIHTGLFPVLAVLLMMRTRSFCSHQQMPPRRSQAREKPLRSGLVAISPDR